MIATVCITSHSAALDPTGLSTRQGKKAAIKIGAGSAVPIGPDMPDADLAVDDLDRYQLVPRDSLGQADLVEGLGKFRLT
jgi:hypothetical protein